MASVYLETSFISACVTDRTDTASLYRRQHSLEWWDAPRFRHDLFISEEVITELSDPAFHRRIEALERIENVESLPITTEIQGVAEILVKELVMPSPVAGDAIHVAVACVNRLDYMLSWNVRHLANPKKLDHLRVVCRRIGLVPPIIVTPDMMWEA